ncbi:S-adenosylmethionine sensor upstream of mTORC1 isoform X1 [Electrophorus electricus]|uniref:S-adenosylmethionine sensor upstream of mTORC1 n=1 Tax=Electrophorus electricus TaxID=8005 RepID=A0A4W4H9I5_ELEEL|nr:S-adenosylmethionine sensor upstream of mTORC1 isoform X1 [Electrophorus electricus]
MELQNDAATEIGPEVFCPEVPKEFVCTQNEQEKLSGVVKSVHRKLRRKYIEVGDFEKIWREHCEDEQTLSEYAVAMKSLADNHWAKKGDGEGRIEWCRSVCQEYFLDGGVRKVLEKDEKAARHAAATCGTPLNTQPDSSLPSFSSNFQFGKMRLLDVGSCFNPFLKFDEFLTVGIDIVPAVESVYKCDFLNLQLQQPLQLAADALETFLRQLHGPIDTLPAQLFHVVVFSLLLSYFPSPYQRWLCCKKAHELLALHGLLLIITPDSSHQGRHARMMHSWRVAVESLGFRRYKTSAHSRTATVSQNAVRWCAPTPRMTSWHTALPNCQTLRTTQTRARARAARHLSTSWRTPFCCTAEACDLLPTSIALQLHWKIYAGLSCSSALFLSFYLLCFCCLFVCFVYKTQCSLHRVDDDVYKDEPK